MEFMRSLEKMQERADCLYTESEVETAIDVLAEQIVTELALARANPLVLCAMKGGLVFCAALLKRWVFPLELDYVHATRYKSETKGGQLQWCIEPSIDLKGRIVLVVDDIFDEGKTLSEIVARCVSQQAEKVYSAVLVEKQHQRKNCQGFKPDYVGLPVEDRYVVGCGMDYQGYFRNLNGIYALAD